MLRLSYGRFFMFYIVSLPFVLMLLFCDIPLLYLSLSTYPFLIIASMLSEESLFSALRR